MTQQLVLSIAGGLILLKLAAEWLLESLNRKHVLAHREYRPELLGEVMDAETYDRSISYTLAKSRLNQRESLLDAAVLAVVLFLLPWLYAKGGVAENESVWRASGFLVLCGILFWIPHLPFDWHRTFSLEARYGFNRATPALWFIDRVKGLLLSVALGWPLLALLLKIVEWAGGLWWLWGWAALFSFQLLIALLAPIVILPLFNKFTPLADGTLKERLLELADKAGFNTSAIQVMDGSKRSGHSNAFFTGFGKGRKIVLFDTLVEQLEDNELAAVLAHEIGHYKLRHILKMLAVSALTTLLGFWVLAQLADAAWFLGAFGFQPGAMAPAFLLFALLAGTVTFWTSPLFNGLSRRHEFEADAFARELVGDPAPLKSALRKLNRENLGNLFPHPLYSRFHYSHPPFTERERALRIPPETSRHHTDT